jgi:hypothetical protein
LSEHVNKQVHRIYLCEMDIHVYIFHTWVSQVKLYFGNEGRALGAVSRWITTNKAGVSYFLFMFFVIMLPRFHNKLSTCQKERKRCNPLGTSVLFKKSSGKRIHSILKARYLQARGHARFHYLKSLYTQWKRVCRNQSCHEVRVQSHSISVAKICWLTSDSIAVAS